MTDETPGNFDAHQDRALPPETNLSDKDIESIAERVIEKMGSVPPYEHVNHHLWIRQRIKEEKTKSQSRRNVAEKVIGTIGAAGVMALLLWLGNAILDQLSTMAGNAPPIEPPPGAADNPPHPPKGPTE